MSTFYTTLVKNHSQRFRFAHRNLAPVSLLAFLKIVSQVTFVSTSDFHLAAVVSQNKENIVSIYLDSASSVSG